jgi:hypothetical protein
LGLILDFWAAATIFAGNQRIMQHEQHEAPHSFKDFAFDWVSSSRFLFYVQVFCIVAFLVGGSYALYKHRYKGKPEVEVPGNTLYTPKYK